MELKLVDQVFLRKWLFGLWMSWRKMWKSAFKMNPVNVKMKTFQRVENLFGSYFFVWRIQIGAKTIDWSEHLLNDVSMFSRIKTNLPNVAFTITILFWWTCVSESFSSENCGTSMKCPMSWCKLYLAAVTSSIGTFVGNHTKSKFRLRLKNWVS